MKFRIERSIFDPFPGLQIVAAVARGVDNAKPNPGLAAAAASAWEKLRAEIGQGPAQDHPRVRAWREAFRRMGLAPRDFRASIEGAARRASRGDPPLQISPVVDLYHAASWPHVVPAGGFDLGVMEGDVELRRTRPGDRFQALGEAGPVDVMPGEIAWADQHTIITRHFVWRQSEHAKITPATRDVFFVAEVLGELGAGVAEAVAADLGALIARHLGVEPAVAIVDQDRPEIPIHP